MRLRMEDFHKNYYTGGLPKKVGGKLVQFADSREAWQEKKGVVFLRGGGGGGDAPMHTSFS